MSSQRRPPTRSMVKLTAIYVLWPFVLGGVAVVAWGEDLRWWVLAPMVFTFCVGVAATIRMWSMHGFREPGASDPTQG